MSSYWSLTQPKREVLISGLIARKHEFEDLLLDANALMAKVSSTLHARQGDKTPSTFTFLDTAV